MKVDNFENKICNKTIIRWLRTHKPAWGSQTIKHSDGKWAGIWPNGDCRAIAFGANDGGLAFLSLSADNKEARRDAVRRHRWLNHAEEHREKLP